MKPVDNIEILCIEDNPGDVELLKLAFNQCDMKYNITVAEDGQAAIEHLQKISQCDSVQAPDFITLDLNMPRMDGKEFLEIVKEDDGLETIPVIVLTSSQSTQDILECYQKQVNAYLVKPDTIDGLNGVVQGMCAFWGHLAKLPKASL